MAFDDPAYRTKDEDFREQQKGRATNAQIIKKNASRSRGLSKAKRIRIINEKGKGALLNKTVEKNLKKQKLGGVKAKVVGGLFKKGKGFAISVVIFSWVITVWLWIQLPIFALSMLAFFLDETITFKFFNFLGESLYPFFSILIMPIGWGSLLIASIQYKWGGVHCLLGKNAAGKILLFAVALAAYGPWPGNFGPWILLWMVYVAYHPE